jgi:malonyl-CoA decarboxylase
MMSRMFIHDLWGVIASRGRGLLGPGKPLSPSGDPDLVQLSRDLISGRGEASGVRRARDLLDAYARAGDETRLGYLTALVDDFGPDEARLEAAIEAFHANKNQETMAALSAASEPRRQEVLRRINHAPGGTAALVNLREDVLTHLKENPALAVLDADFVHLFSSWFNRGFLVLRPIDWTTPANILAKIIRYEAVHTIQSWDDLRNRLEPPDRRCFAFFHPQMADEPLVFVEVALMRDMPDAIAPLLDLDRTPLASEEATTAVFYSISNCQVGLKGISFGNFLIKQVVEELKRDLPNLKTFVTLSPVPGFMNWLKRAFEQPSSVFLAEDSRILTVLADSSSGEQPAAQEEVRRAQLAAAAHYFLVATKEDGKPVDPVARFHLGNGARLERINYRGDISPNGMRQAGGLMVNYLYDLEAIETNHEAFANQGKITASPAVRQLLQGMAQPAKSIPSPSSASRRISGETR